MLLLGSVVVTLIVILVILIVAISSPLKESAAVRNNFPLSASELCKFLDVAETYYQKMLEMRDVGPFRGVCSEDVSEHLQDVLCCDQLPLFVGKAYRTTEWEYLDFFKEENTYLVRREVKFNNVRIRGVPIPLGDDNEEYWLIKALSKCKFIIEDIL